MATSPFFNNYSAKNEQKLVEDLIVESIKIMGFDAYYLPNDNDQARDLLFGEDPVKKFESAFPVEFYLSNSLDYAGDKDFFSKFGLEVRNEASVIVSKRSFAQRTPSFLTRPREGDLIYVPFLNGTGELYEIKFTSQNKDMMMLGRKVPYFYELELEKFKYSHEVLNTGIDEIDSIPNDTAYKLDLVFSSGSGDYTFREIVFQSPDNTYANATSTAVVQNWNAVSKILEVTTIKGDFTDGESIIGHTGGANWTLVSFDPLSINTKQEQYDNRFIANQANNIIDLTETNPFGSI